MTVLIRLRLERGNFRGPKPTSMGGSCRPCRAPEPTYPIVHAKYAKRQATEVHPVRPRRFSIHDPRCRHNQYNAKPQTKDAQCRPALSRLSDSIVWT